MENFLKLRPNKEAMDSIYKKYSKVFYNENENENISFDYFLNSTPDSELQSIFFLLLIAEIYYKKNDVEFSSEVINLFDDKFMKLEKQSQIIIIKQLLKINILPNSNNYIDILFQKISDNQMDINKEYKDSELLLKDFDKVLSNFKETETQSLFCWYIFEKVKKKSIFLMFNKNIQIYLFKEFSHHMFPGPLMFEFMDKIDIEVLVQYLEYMKDIDEIRANVSPSFKKFSDEEFCQGFYLFLKGREEEAFKCFSFKSQISIIEGAPADKKVGLFSLLPDKNRIKKTLESLKNIDKKAAEKYLYSEKKEIKENKGSSNYNVNTNSGLSKEAFKERLKLFNSNK